MIGTRRMAIRSIAGMIPQDVGTPTRPATPIRRKPPSRFNPCARLFIHPDDSTEGRACRDDPSCTVALNCSATIYGYYVPGGNDAFGDSQTEYPDSFPPSPAELQLSAEKAARDVARSLYEYGHWRGYGEYHGGQYSGAITIFNYGTIRNTAASSLTNFFFHPDDAVSSSSPTAMINKPSGWSPFNGNSDVPTGQFSVYIENGVAMMLDNWTPNFMAALKRECDYFVPDGGGAPVQLCYPAELHWDWEDNWDLRNFHNSLFSGGWVRQTDMANHIDGALSDGTPTDRFENEVIWINANGDPSTFEDWWNAATVSGYWDGSPSLPIEVTPFYSGIISNLAYEFAHFTRCIAEYGLEQTFNGPYRAMFPGLQLVSNWNFVHKVPFGSTPTELGFDYGWMRHPMMNCQAIDAYGPNDAGLVGAETVDIEERWAAIEVALATVDMRKPCIVWTSFGNDGTPGSALTFGSHAQQLEILKRLWLRGFFLFYPWGPAGTAIGNVEAWHENVWQPFRAWVAQQARPRNWKRLESRASRGRPSRGTKIGARA